MFAHLSMPFWNAESKSVFGSIRSKCFQAELPRRTPDKADKEANYTNAIVSDKADEEARIPMFRTAVSIYRFIFISHLREHQ